MPNRTLDALWHDMVRNFRLQRPCYVVVYGPPGAGKTEFIDDIEERCGCEDSVKVILLRLDLRDFVPNEPSLMFGKVVGRLHVTATAAGIKSNWSGKAKADAADLNSVVLSWLSSIPDCILLGIDHIDAAPRSLLRILLRGLRAFNDESAANPEYNRIGAVIAGATTVHELREELYSTLVGSNFVALPSADPSFREELVSDFLAEQKIAAGRGVVQLLAEWTGGERSHMTPVIRNVSVDGTARLSEQKLLAVLPKIKLEEIYQGARELALLLAVDDEFQKYAERLIQSSGAIPARRIVHEIDLFQIYGAFIRIPGKGTATYVARNLLVRSFLDRVLRVLDKSDSSLAPEIATYLHEYAEIRCAIQTAIGLEPAAKALVRGWQLLTGNSEAELVFLLRAAGTDGGHCFRFGDDAQLRPFPLLANDSVARIVTDGSESSRDWVTAESGYMSAISARWSEKGELRVLARIARSQRRNAFSEVALGSWFWLLSSVSAAIQDLVAREVGWRLIMSANKSMGVVQTVTDKKKVFVVHGRNGKLRTAMFSFLRSIGLQPLEWSVVVDATGKGSPTIDEILKKGFDLAQAAVVIMTGDDEAKLRDEYLSAHDKATEGVLQPQARPNVLYEAGMAMGRYPDRTILVEVPPLRPFTDIAGMHTIRIDNSTQRRQELANRLHAAGCEVELRGTSWHNEGDFSSASKSRKSKVAAK